MADVDGIKVEKNYRLDTAFANNGDIQELMERLRPICCFDPEKPQAYRDLQEMRSILKKAVLPYVQG